MEALHGTHSNRLYLTVWTGVVGVDHRGSGPGLSGPIGGPDADPVDRLFAAQDGLDRSLFHAFAL